MQSISVSGPATPQKGHGHCCSSVSSALQKSMPCSKKCSRPIQSATLLSRQDDMSSTSQCCISDRTGGKFIQHFAVRRGFSGTCGEGQMKLKYRHKIPGTHTVTSYTGSGWDARGDCFVAGADMQVASWLKLSLQTWSCSEIACQSMTWCMLQDRYDSRRPHPESSICLRPSATLVVQQAAQGTACHQQLRQAQTATGTAPGPC